MPNWEEIQTHAKRFIDEGMKMLHAGMNEASYLAEATAKAANLHVSLRRNRYDRYRVVHEIGRYVSDECMNDSSKNEIKLTDNIRKKMDEVKALDEYAREFEAEMSKLTVTNKGKSLKSGTN